MKGWRGRYAVVAAPGVVLAAVLAAALALSAAGRSPIWPDQRINLSEAVAAGADAEILRLRGSRLDVAYEVRPGLLSDQAMRATPLEAAVLAHRTDYLDRLLGDAAPLDAASWNRLRCLTDDDGAAVLERHRPAAAAMHCAP
jgi:hypothetical protein